MANCDVRKYLAFNARYCQKIVLTLYAQLIVFIIRRRPLASKEANKREKRVGEFLVEKKIISQAQLNDALVLQKDNKGRLIGEILVTLGALSKEDLVMALEIYLVETDVLPTHVDEWLDQDEVDLIMERLKKK